MTYGGNVAPKCHSWIVHTAIALAIPDKMDLFCSGSQCHLTQQCSKQVGQWHCGAMVLPVMAHICTARMTKFCVWLQHYTEYLVIYLFVQALLAIIAVSGEWCKLGVSQIGH